MLAFAIEAGVLYNILLIYTKEGTLLCSKPFSPDKVCTDAMLHTEVQFLQRNPIAHPIKKTIKFKDCLKNI